MKSLHDSSFNGKCRELWQKIRGKKNIEIIIAVILAGIAIIVYIGVSLKGSADKNNYSATSVMTGEMSKNEKRLAETISQIEGVGDCTALISVGTNNEVIGVIVVAQGANDMDKKVRIIRCVELATGVSVDQIQVYQMSNGG